MTDSNETMCNTGRMFISFESFLGVILKRHIFLKILNLFTSIITNENNDLHDKLGDEQQSSVWLKYYCCQLESSNRLELHKPKFQSKTYNNYT
ncbi:hypothetical protein BLOT_009870 [Blomia tropicalis]|nr:hypothetical protein BLOT_009870 [Blomia tropicalis]